MQWVSTFANEFSCAHFLFFSGSKMWWKFCQNPIMKHFLVLLQFFLFGVILLFADIVTDIITAVDFYLNGQTYWCLFTTLPIFAPLLARIILSFVSFCRCFKFDKNKLQKNPARFNLWCQDLGKIIWHFPLLQPLRY